MNVYYIHHERGFANEYTLAAAEQGSDAQAFLEVKGFERITRREFERLLRRRHDQAGVIGTGMCSKRNVAALIADSVKGTFEYAKGGRYFVDSLA